MYGTVNIQFHKSPWFRIYGYRSYDDWRSFERSDEIILFIELTVDLAIFIYSEYKMIIKFNFTDGR